MNLKLLIATILLLLYTGFFAIAQDNVVDSKNHLQVKLDVITPIISLIPSIKTYTFGASLEYKMKSKWGLQLNGYYYWENNYTTGDRDGYLLIPEFRYYFHNHLAGIYLKFDRYQYPNALHEWTQEFWNQNIGYGILYGYQKEIKRFIIEGRVGIGINHNTKNPSGYTGNYYLMMDTILAFNIGWRIL